MDFMDTLLGDRNLLVRAGLGSTGAPTITGAGFGCLMLANNDTM